MSIIVEGVDGTGKTSLIRRLQRDIPGLKSHPRFATSTGGPVDNLATKVYEDVDSLLTGKWVYDRHPVISEYIYGHELPARTVDPDFFTWEMTYVRKRIMEGSLVIWCIPPLYFIKNSVIGDKNQLAGVEERISELYNAYCVAAAQWHGDSITFDYVNDNYNFVYELVRAFLYMKGLNR